MSGFTPKNQNRDSDEIKVRTKTLLDLFKKNYLASKSNDFTSDAIGNMLVCLSTYEKIFEGFLLVSEKRKMPQEMTDGFVKWATDQLDELKISLNVIYEKRDMR